VFYEKGFYNSQTTATCLAIPCFGRIGSLVLARKRPGEVESSQLLVVKCHLATLRWPKCQWRLRMTVQPSH